nr:MAG TPA: hypothetical protein [Caudoviricetes sp.]
MRCDRRHAHVGCVHHRHMPTVDAMKTEAHIGSNVHLVRRRMSDTIIDILMSDDSKLVGRNFLTVTPVDNGYSDVNIIHVTADNIHIMRGMASYINLDIYELTTTEE